MGTAKEFFSSKDNRWVFTERGGSVVAEIDGVSARFPNGAKIGGGTEIAKIGKLTGTILGLAAVGTVAGATSTISGMTGLEIGDTIKVTPKAAINANYIVGNFYIPTTNTLNVTIHNINTASAGSLVPVGVDVEYTRYA